MGRKPAGEPAKEHGILVRVTEAERDELIEAAKREGKKTSAWLRDLGLIAARSTIKKKSVKPTSSTD